jgi:hypothetical protein
VVLVRFGNNPGLGPFHSLPISLLTAKILFSGTFWDILRHPPLAARNPRCRKIRSRLECANPKTRLAPTALTAATSWRASNRQANVEGSGRSIPLIVTITPENWYFPLTSVFFMS